MNDLTSDAPNEAANESANDAANELPRWQQRISSVIVVFLFLACANVLAYRYIDADMWGHIQYGEDWIAAGQLPRTASHTYADPNYPWINHENLSELAMALTHRFTGGWGLVIGKTVLGLAILLVMFINARRQGVSALVAAACMLPVSGGLAEFFCIRPQLASFVAMTITLVLLNRAFQDWATGLNVHWPSLAMLLPVMVLWTNAHGGFLAGLGVIGTYLGVRSLEAIWTLRGQATGLVIKIAVVGIACVGVTLINPYHVNLHRWLVHSLGQPRPEISEWVSIFDGGVTAIPFGVLMLLTVLAALGSNRRWDRAEGLVMLVVIAQTCHHCRHLPFFALLFGFWIPVHLQSALCRWFPRRETSSKADAPSNTALAMLAIQAAVVGLLLSGGLVWRLANFGVPRDEYPVGAMEYMAQQGLQGKIVVTFDWAQYTLAALPDSRVGFDGRFRTCYPQRVVDMNFDLTLGDLPEHRHRAAESKAVDPTSVLDFGNPDFVLIDRQNNPAATQVMEQQTAWVLLYQDALARLYGRASRFDNRQIAEYIPPSERKISSQPQTGIAPWPGFPDRSGPDAFRNRKP